MSGSDVFAILFLFFVVIPVGWFVVSVAYALIRTTYLVVTGKAKDHLR